MIDPSGLFGVVGMMGSIASFVSYSVNQAAISAIATAVINSITFAVGSYNVGQHIVERGFLPDGIILTLNGGIASRGLQGGLTTSVYFDMRKRNAYLLGGFEAGTAPLSAMNNFNFARTGKFSKSATLGFVWNADSVTDMTGYAINASMPYVTNRVDLQPTMHENWFGRWRTLVTTMANYSRSNFIVNHRYGSMTISQSLSGQTVATSLGVRNYNFASTVSYNWLIYDANQVGTWLGEFMVQVQAFFQPVFTTVNDTELFAKNVAEAIDRIEQYYDNTN
jgi:hypothetical protein